MPPLPPHQPATASRRGLLLSTPLLASVHARALLPAVAAVAPKPVLDQPMRRLRLPSGTIGRDYLLLQLTIQAGPGPAGLCMRWGAGGRRRLVPQSCMRLPLGSCCLGRGTTG